VIAVLEEMEQILGDERQALLRGDWQTLQSCVTQKRQLSELLSTTAPEAGLSDQVLRLRSAALHNAKLASALSKQLSAMLSSRSTADPVVYNNWGAQRQTATRSILNLRT